MIISSVTLHHIQMKLKAPFTASYGSFTDRDFIIVEACDNNGFTGWGECAAFATPWYNEETVKTAWHMLADFLIPLLLENNISHPKQLPALFHSIRRNNMAKAAIDEAVWDLYAKQKGQPLAALLGGNKTKIEVGAAIGMQKNKKEWLQAIEQKLDDGYKRIKVKIKPGMEEEILAPIRTQFPNLPLMVDANAAYSLTDIDRLQALDVYGLMMIEQPLAAGDMLGHASLQKEMQTPICLDESITSYEEAKQAIAQQSCRIINVKIARVGGITEAMRIHDLCLEHDIPVWCGGMLESGIGRAHNIALSSLENFSLPGDTSASSRYWTKDIITPEVVVNDGFIHVPAKPGIGYDINRKELKKHTLSTHTFRASSEH